LQLLLRLLSILERRYQRCQRERLANPTRWTWRTRRRTRRTGWGVEWNGRKWNQSVGPGSRTFLFFDFMGYSNQSMEENYEEDDKRGVIVIYSWRCLQDKSALQARCDDEWYGRGEERLCIILMDGGGAERWIDSSSDNHKTTHLLPPIIIKPKKKHSIKRGAAGGDTSYVILCYRLYTLVSVSALFSYVLRSSRLDTSV
jgi:hypothetical protein